VPPIYQPNPHFVGRDDLIEHLRQKLCASRSQTYNHRVALYGMGGVGKTQCAIEYVFKYRAEYHSVFWISAATTADFQTGFQQIAEKTKCATDSEKNVDAITKAVLEWLATRT
jgi:Holliday junction resolvasome RuvABC ATP-dependent DNA helicase subunit